MEFLFPEYRLDWFGAGPSSPNKTGALLAILFIAAWWPALRFRWGFWLSLPLAFVAAVFLLQTESRGALVGAGAAVVMLVGFRMLAGRCFGTLAEASRYVFPLRLSALIVAGTVLVFYSQQVGVNDRMAAMASGEDGSSNVRVALYSAGLQMIAAAPLGWGHGQSGNAYGQWYQKVGDSRSYLSLVNSHLTWMADYGLFFQFFYIAGWCLVFMLCWPVPWTPLRGVTFGAWITLGVCGFFSSVLTLVWLWILPALLLLLCVAQKIHMGGTPTIRKWRAALVALLLGFFGLQGLAQAIAVGSPIAANPKRVEIGAHPQRVALIEPDRQILGDKYGHTIREYLGQIEGFTVLREVNAATNLKNYDLIVFSGMIPEKIELNDMRGIVLMNPPSMVDESMLKQLNAENVSIIVGSLGDWRRSRLWGAWADERAHWQFMELRGVADFVPGWPRYLSEKFGPDGQAHVTEKSTSPYSVSKI